MSFRRSDGNWAKVNSPRFAEARPCLFLDRDGVLIEERNYLKDPDLVELIAGATATIARAAKLGWAVAVVTNQSGIARGLISWDEYEAVERRVEALLAKAGVAVDIVLACPYVTNGLPPFDRDDEWRKPGPGMLLEAQSVLNVDLARSALVGDRLSDLQAAENAGLKTVVHVETGYGADERAEIAKSLRAGTRLHAVRSIADVGTVLESAGTKASPF